MIRLFGFVLPGSAGAGTENAIGGRFESSQLVFDVTGERGLGRLQDREAVHPRRDRPLALPLALRDNGVQLRTAEFERGWLGLAIAVHMLPGFLFDLNANV